MEPRQRLIRQTTTRGRAGRPTLGLCSAIADSDLPGARLNLALGGEPNREALKLPGIAGRLSATAIAVRSDSDRDELLFLPWMLDRGGNIGEVDSRGRTLLHHAQTRTVALHLLERGVPVANGMRDALLDAFRAPAEEGGVAEVHVVFTQFVNMVTQRPRVIRLLPLEIVEGVAPADDAETLPLYEFEPEPAVVLDALLPRYVRSRIYACLLQAAASELAARQRAMHTATENAEDLIRMYTRLANQARQGEITQEISEIVSGADALAS